MISSGLADRTVFLLADNDLARQDIIYQALQAAGNVDVLQAEDGAEAWGLFATFKVEVVICFWDLPEVNGISLLKLVRSKENHLSTPFILLANQLTPKTVIKAGKAGVTDIILTPFTADAARARILKLLAEVDSPEKKEAERSYRQGLELMKSGKLDEALKKFERLLSVHENAEIYYNLGYIKAAKGQLEDALVMFRKATMIDGDHARAYKKMAEILAALGKKNEAENFLRLAGDIHFDRHEDREAEEAYLEILKINPETVNVFNSLGIIYRRQERFTEALAQYTKALKVHPNDENINYNVARAHVSLKNFDQAGQYLEHALRLNPGFSKAIQLQRFVEMRMAPPA
ncbi:MAG: tetratricopeptide repeat protein [Pseudomonadota bacterium]